MQRRRFLTGALLGGVALPAFGQGLNPEIARFARSKEYGVAVRPPLVMASDGRFQPMNGARTHMLAVGEHIKAALGNRLDGFAEGFKTQLREALERRGLPATDVPLMAERPFSSPFGAERPFYLDCHLFLTFFALGDGLVAPGAGVGANLLNRYRDHLHYCGVSYGFVEASMKTIGVPSDRFSDLNDVMTSPDAAAKTLLDLSAPLARALAFVFARDTIGAQE